MAERYDAIVIGTGQGGKPLALALAGAGWKTAVIERKWVGGSCVNYGCTPTKTMIASARVAYLSRRAAVYGVDAGPVRVDMARVRQRKRTLVESFRSRSQTRLEQSPNSELIFGEASFLGRDTVAVKLARGGARELRAPNIFINVGLRPARPAIPGLDQVKALDSTSIMELDEVPQHLIVLGGGYVGLEFGQMFRRFGSQVSIVEAGPQLLSLEDGDVADEMAKILREDGIEILLATKVESAAQEGSSIRLTLSSVHGQRELTGSHLLVAVGRVPDTAALELAAAGVATDERGFVRVSDRLETSIPDIYAIGDVKGGPAFTHISYDDYRILETNLLKGGNATVRGRLVPYCVFTDPELGRVGK